MLRLLTLALMATLWAAAAPAASDDESWRRLLVQGIAQRQQGNLTAGLALLREARLSAKSATDAALAAGELGAACLQAQRLDEAEEALQAAHAALDGEARGRIANDLGNLFLARKQMETARRYYLEAANLGSEGTALRATARLNLIRLASRSERLAQLSDLLPALERIDDRHARSQLLLNLGSQAQALGMPAIPLAHASLERARSLAADSGKHRLQLEVLDALSQLYESTSRWDDTLALTQHALDIARSQPDPDAQLGDLLLQLEWRQGRVLVARQQPEPALAGYQRAVGHAQALRQDMPIELADGRSAYQAILEPLHLEYLELLLDSLVRQPQERHQTVLRHVREAIEVLRQSEMQDFLGDRCSVEETAGNHLEDGVAILYPILLKDRIELLLETAAGLSRRSVPVTGIGIRNAAREFAAVLRNGESGYLAPARQLHDALIRPIEPLLNSQRTHTLVVVADGELRLVPFAALHDGSAFLIERMAVTAVTGMSMTNTSGAPGKTFQSLLAGVAQPGPVVDKLAATDVLRSIGGTSRGLSPGGMLTKGRSLRSASIPEPAGPASREARAAALRESLALPGVEEEVRSIGKTLQGSMLLDAAFTVEHFRDESETGSYRVVHIASHGVFGGSAETSFILAYDDLLGINRLQTLLQSENLRRNPIELLTLSACETAEGNQRAPLGISGAAIRARAKSVLGTLWPVEDTAARITMGRFYEGIASGKLSKAAALQQAQRQLIADRQFGHPFFWAPFSLIGNWR